MSVWAPFSLIHTDKTAQAHKVISNPLFYTPYPHPQMGKGFNLFWFIHLTVSIDSGVTFSNKSAVETLTMLYQYLDISYFDNSVDPDQLASQKPADLDLHCFPLSRFIDTR